MRSPGHASALQQIVGADNYLSVEESGAYALGGATPEVGTVFPDSFEEVEEVVRLCSAEQLTVAAVGSGTRSWQCSKPDRLSVVVSTRRLAAVTDYQPENLVLAAQAGMPGAQAADLLSQKNQVLTLDPPGFAQSTLGSIAATRTAGSARAQFGTPKDLLIGATIVNAEGKRVKAGGKVMKHVAGYDLTKLYAGSYGTLGIIVETIWRLSPLPVRSVAAAALMPDLASADNLAAALGSSYLQPRCLDVLNQTAASGVLPEWPARAAVAVVAIFDGGQTQAEHQAQQFEELANAAGALECSRRDGSWNQEFHRALADARVPGCDRLWEVYAPPSMLPQVFAIASALPECAVSGSAASGVVRIAARQMGANASADLTRALMSLSGVRVAAFSSEPGTAEEVWLAPPDGLALMSSIKAKLDPDGVLASGRFVGGI